VALAALVPVASTCLVDEKLHLYILPVIAAHRILEDRAEHPVPEVYYDRQMERDVAFDLGKMHTSGRENVAVAGVTVPVAAMSAL
jgi:hypothetical protein